MKSDVIQIKKHTDWNYPTLSKLTIRWHEKQANLRYFFQKKMLEVIGLLSDQLLEINPFMIDYQYSLISETVLKVCKKRSWIVKLCLMMHSLPQAISVPSILQNTMRGWRLGGKVKFIYLSRSRRALSRLWDLRDL